MQNSSSRGPLSRGGVLTQRQRGSAAPLLWRHGAACGGDKSNQIINVYFRAHVCCVQEMRDVHPEQIGGDK